MKRNFKSKDGRFAATVLMPSEAAIAVAMAHRIKGPNPVVMNVKSIPKKQRQSGAQNE